MGRATIGRASGACVCHRCRVMSIAGKPILIDKLDATLAAKISEAIIKDNERVKRARKAKRKKKRAAKGATVERP